MNKVKYLSNYIEKGQELAFTNNGAFFAFGNKQFEENKKDGVVYVNCGSGLICPKDNADKLFKELNEITAKGIELDLQENGKEYIIKRELSNYECYYTGDISDAVDVLKKYNISEDEVIKIFKAS